MVEFSGEVGAPVALGEGGIDGVLEIVGVAVAFAAEVEPGVGVLVGEERRVVDEGAVAVSDDGAAVPGVPGVGGEGFFGSADAEEVEAEEFAVAVPAVRDETGFGAPAVGEGGAVVKGPLPVDAGVEFVDEVGDLRVAEVFAGEEGAFEEEGGVDRGGFAVPGAFAGGDFDEVVDPAAFVVDVVEDEAESEAGATDGFVAGEPVAVGGDAPGGEGEAGGGDAGGCVGAGAVDRGAIAGEAGDGVGVFLEVAEGAELEVVEEGGVFDGEDCGGRGGGRKRDAWRGCGDEGEAGGELGDEEPGGAEFAAGARFFQVSGTRVCHGYFIGRRRAETQEVSSK